MPIPAASIYPSLQLIRATPFPVLDQVAQHGRILDIVDSVTGFQNDHQDLTAVRSSGNITLSGSVVAADTVTAVINGVSVVVTAVTGETLTTLANKLARAINGTFALRGIAYCVVTGTAVVNVFAGSFGSGGNYTLTTSKTGTVVSTASAATLTGGAGGPGHVVVLKAATVVVGRQVIQLLEGKAYAPVAAVVTALTQSNVPFAVVQ